MVDKIAEYRKAIAAFLVPALVVLGASLADGVVTLQEWIAVAIAALGTSVAVGAIPNEINPRNVKEPETLAASLVSEANRRVRASEDFEDGE